MIKKCPGCGATLQYTDENKVGYTPKKDAKLCERCFKLKNYNQKSIIDLKYSNSDIINLLNNKADLVLFITDFLNLNKKIVETYNQINVTKKVFIINKVDYIPNSINKEKYINWIKSTYLIKDNIILVSAEKNYNIRVINNILDESKNPYICGYTNSGKSTIINKLSEINEKKSNILTSLMPNTTLDVIKIKLDVNKYVYDTPGFINDFDFNDNLYPKKFLKPVTLQLKDNDIVSLNNEIFIKTDKATSLTFYMSNELNIKKVYDSNINLTNEIDISDNADLVINGYGFINIKNSCNIKINLNTKDIEVRTSMF